MYFVFCVLLCVGRGLGACLFAWLLGCSPTVAECVDDEGPDSCHGVTANG